MGAWSWHLLSIRCLNKDTTVDPGRYLAALTQSHFITASFIRPDSITSAKTR